MRFACGETERTHLVGSKLLAPTLLEVEKKVCWLQDHSYMCLRVNTTINAGISDCTFVTLVSYLAMIGILWLSVSQARSSRPIPSSLKRGGLQLCLLLISPYCLHLCFSIHRFQAQDQHQVPRKEEKVKGRRGVFRVQSGFRIYNCCPTFTLLNPSCCSTSITQHLLL